MSQQQDSGYLFSVKNFIFYGFLVFFVIVITRRVWFGSYFSKYVFTEWLINYSQGFVRRGLPGTVLLFLKQNFNIDSYPIVRYFLGYLTFTVFSGIYLLKIKQNIKVLNWESLIIFLLLPCLILFPIYDLSVIGRKEFFFLFALLLNIFILSRTSLIKKLEEVKENSSRDNPDLAEEVNNYCHNLFIWFNLLSIVSALSHETVLFLSIPINLMITFSVFSVITTKKQAIFKSLIIYLPTILVALLGYLWKGDESMAQAICKPLREIYSINCMNDSAFMYLGWSLKDSLKAVIELHSNKVFLWIIIFILNTLVLMRASSILVFNSLNRSKFDNIAQNFSLPVERILTSFSIKYLLFPFLISLPLYVLALDWGRWYFIITISYAICLLSPSLIRLEVIHNNQKYSHLPSYLAVMNSTYSETLNFLIVKLPRFYPVYFLIFAYTLLMTRVPIWNMKSNALYGGFINLIGSRFIR